MWKTTKKPILWSTDTHAADLMKSNVLYLHNSQTIKEALCIFENNNFTCIPVCDKKEAIMGVVWLKDVLRNKEKNTPLNGILSSCFLTLSIDSTEEEILNIFSLNQRCNSVYIIDDKNRIKGLLSKSGVMTLLIKEHANSILRTSRVNELFLPENSFLINAFSSMHEGIVVVDSDTRVLFVNESYTKILGVKEVQVLHKHLNDIEPNARILSVLRTGIPVNEERIYIESLGITIIANINPIHTGDKITGAISSFFDITEILQLANDLRTTNTITAHMQSELENEIKLPSSFSKIVSNSIRFRKELALAARVAGTDSSVLIVGESGTGKELVAEAIHMTSRRKNNPFVKLNCSAIPENLLESELFGYDEGSFTGARKGGKPGKVEIANEGTLFLDEIGDMPLSMQPKLLRFLQEGTFDRVGDVNTKKVNVRIIAATNKDLSDLIKKSLFRHDLFFRVNTFTIFLYPLRERKSDIISLVRYFTVKYNEKYGKNTFFSNHCIDMFLDYGWPGNVRELMNVVEHSVVLSDRQLITEENLPFYFREERQSAESKRIESLFKDNGFPDLIGQYERELLLDALYSCHQNRTKAAEMLGMSRRAFYYKLSKYNIVIS